MHTHRFNGLAGLQKHAGGTLLGLIIGLIIGLAVAVVVAIYITNAPTPFQKPPSPAAPQDDAASVDPNKPLQSKISPRPVMPPPPAETQPTYTPEPSPAPTTATAPAILETPLPDSKPTPAVAPSPKTAKADKPAPAPAANTDPIRDLLRKQASSTAPASTTADVGKASYLLQVGAYKSIADAERQKANLAMNGFESAVSEREINGIQLFRVRMGPYRSMEELERMRSKMQDAGISASVIRVQE